MSISGVDAFGAGVSGISVAFRSPVLIKMGHLAGIFEFGIHDPGLQVWLFAALTLVFACLGKAVRGVTSGGALAGAAVCFGLLWGAGMGTFAALFTVFLLTWIATRFGYARKQRLGTAEAGSGRDALQVLANLGAGSACAILYATVWPDRRLLVAIAAALAEAAADTVSSEIGQAIGGVPRLVTTWKRTAVGADGAITVAGTLAGIAAAFVVALVCVLTGLVGWSSLPLCVAAGICGMMVDSLLGAALERRGILGNNEVNFISTAASAVTAVLLSQISR